MKQIVTIGFTLFLGFALGAQTPDPGLSGPFSTSFDEYNLGNLAFKPDSFPLFVEVRANVHYPSDTTAGPFPLVVFMHGRHTTCYNNSNPSITDLEWPCDPGFSAITSFEGYDYLGEKLASHGYVVISVSANGINADDNSLSNRGMFARAELIQHHIDLWHSWDTSGAGPFGDRFKGQIDFQNIGTMGHSRGGEGVMRHAWLNNQQGQPYGIKAILPLAPTDFGYPVINHIPIMNVAPYCDGDVSSMAGVHYYDHARYNDTADTTAKHSLLLLGGNHNFFSTVWTPGMYIAGTADDWDDYRSPTTPFCGSLSSSSGRLDATTQQNTLVAYALAFFRMYLGAEDAFWPILNGDDLRPPSSSGLAQDEVFMSYHPGFGKRKDIHRIEMESDELVNNLMGLVIDSSLLEFDICADDLGEIDCSPAFSNQEPHSGGSGVLGMAQLGLEWDNPQAYYENQIPPPNADWRLDRFLQFRVAVDFLNTPSGETMDFSIVLIDSSGEQDSIKVSDFSDALYFPPGSSFGRLPKMMHNTIKIPLDSFKTVDQEKIQGLRFVFDQKLEGALFFGDIALSGERDLPPPSQINNPELSSIKIFPNPNQGSFKLKMPDSESPEEIRVFDLNGKLVFKTKGKTSIQLPEHLEGYFLLEVNTKDVIARKPFLLIR